MKSLVPALKLKTIEEPIKLNKNSHLTTRNGVISNHHTFSLMNSDNLHFIPFRKVANRFDIKKLLDKNPSKRNFKNTNELLIKG